MSMKGFLAAARTGVVTVEFRKVKTGEFRRMPCTLNNVLSEGNVPEILPNDLNEEGSHFAVWAVDVKGWRSFRLDTVERWYVGYPEVQDE